MTSTTSEAVHLDEAFMADPHALYARLRAEGRQVVRAVMPRGLPVWLVTSYRDVRAALADPRLAKSHAGVDAAIKRHTGPDSPPQYFEQLNETMITSDPPNHTRLRKLVLRGFTGRAVAALRPAIDQIATGLADDIARAAGNGVVDLIETFAYPLPMAVSCQMFGVPDEDRADFRTWANILTSAAEPDEFEAAADAFANYLAGLVTSKRAQPGDDMLSAIVAGGEDDRLTDAEAVAMAFLLLSAGHETTVNMISSGTLALLTNADQLARVSADHSLLPGAVEEFLRWESPVNLATMRYTTEPITIAGVEIGAGEIVLLALGAANRDPDYCERPDEVDVTRDIAPNVAFGYGVHYCLGVSLARLQGEIAFRTLLTRFPRMSLVDPPNTLTWRDSPTVRGLTHLRVRLG
ncbi:cytochrome [Actinosynnema sp. ALI-1.44]|uniref:cytochrome P450 family protein n=1 Tax=Actinosynnema sp. ALI-1.44 TaxID=1933779 RepID=UPI00097BBF8F|nr:cytochrome P450 [Actinosynnema sp. ALI-1.44]ONI81491.1 cytochrome [Actinosynnema sp. ALI-1.44]